MRDWWASTWIILDFWSDQRFFKATKGVLAMTKSLFLVLHVQKYFEVTKGGLCCES
jgi:hypothetical protein